MRLTYDHKASDKREAARIEKEGGTIEDGRVDGVLIPTRALGDPEMNHYVTSNPYTTEIELGDSDEVLILACDGVRRRITLRTNFIDIQLSCGTSSKTKRRWISFVVRAMQWRQRRSS